MFCVKGITLHDCWNCLLPPDLQQQRIWFGFLLNQMFKKGYKMSKLEAFICEVELTDKKSRFTKMQMVFYGTKGKDLGCCWLTSCCSVVVLPYAFCFFPCNRAFADEIECLFAFLVSGTPWEDTARTGWGHSTCVNRRDATKSVLQRKISLQEKIASNVFLSKSRFFTHPDIIQKPGRGLKQNIIKIKITLLMCYFIKWSW